MARLSRFGAPAPTIARIPAAIKRGPYQPIGQDIGSQIARNFQTNTRVIVTFDREILRKNWHRINESPLKRAGLYVRRVAINSIKKAERAKKAKTRQKPSSPGTPPKSRAPGHPLRLIFSVVSKLETNAIVGPIKLTTTSSFSSRGHPVPEVHEKGLSKKVRAYGFRRRGKKIKPGTFSRKRFESRSVRYPKRPYMVPAMKKAKQKLPAFWEGSLNNA